MKSTLSVLMLVLVLLAGVAAGYFLAQNPDPFPPETQPTATPDPMIVIDAPPPGGTVASPLNVTGRARGNWYFEATFPIVLTDGNGKKLAETFATAQTDWMTTDWVPFVATVTFTVSDADTPGGFLILKKDNPSGQPQLDDARTIPVQF